MIELAEVLEFGERFHHVVGTEKGSGEDQSAFFLHPEPRIFILHEADVSLAGNWEIHQRIGEEHFEWMEPWSITQLCDEPERARATGAVLWQGQSLDQDGLMQMIVGEDWIVQRIDDGSLRFALYVNTFHYPVPGAATVSIKVSD